MRIRTLHFFRSFFVDQYTFFNGADLDVIWKGFRAKFIYDSSANVLLCLSRNTEGLDSKYEILLIQTKLIESIIARHNTEQFVEKK